MISRFQSIHYDHLCRINITEPSAAMSSQTTARAHFKSWELAPTRPFSEMPAVVGNKPTMINQIMFLFYS